MVKTARFDLVGEVARSWSEETGETVTRATASVIVDRMCQAFVDVMEFEGVEYAVSRQPEVARHLMWRWTGNDGRVLRAECLRQGIAQ